MKQKSNDYGKIRNFINGLLTSLNYGSVEVGTHHWSNITQAGFQIDADSQLIKSWSKEDWFQVSIWKPSSDYEELIIENVTERWGFKRNGDGKNPVSSDSTFIIQKSMLDITEMIVLDFYKDDFNGIHWGRFHFKKNFIELKHLIICFERKTCWVWVFRLCREVCIFNEPSLKTSD